MSTSPSIEARAVSKKRGERTILDRVSVSAAQGEVLALVGESGSGKSTLLRCMQGLEAFDGGEILVGGKRLRRAGEPIVHAVRVRVGIVLQQYHLFLHRTAIENVIEAPIHVLGVDEVTARKEALALLARLGVAHRKNARPGSMSGGEQQRVAIARALAMKPDVILMDEPTAALDPARRKEVARMIRELSQSGTTIVTATHDITFANDVADRTLTLEAGVVTGASE
ncbi:amino acid ABC transporter ATP-binding protein [soil metagenome]